MALLWRSGSADSLPSYAIFWGKSERYRALTTMPGSTPPLSSAAATAFDAYQWG
jgi:hypothetical protein